MAIVKRWTAFALVVTMLFTLKVGVSSARAEDENFDGYIVKLKPEAEKVSLLGFDSDSELKSVDYTDGLYVTDSKESADEFLKQGLAEYAVPNYEMELLGNVPNDPYYKKQWTMPAIDFSMGKYDGKGVTIALIDTGLDVGHEDFEGIKISPYSKNFLGDGEHGDEFYRDQKEHGTFVASRIAAVSNNGKGICGISDGVELMVLRCTSAKSSARYPYDAKKDSQSGTIAVISSAIRYAADKGADIINISMGTDKSEAAEPLQEAVSYAREKGAVIVAASGNDGGTKLFYPACSDGVIGVGSVSKSGDGFKRSYFSQHNISVDFTAPGGDVMGIYPEVIEGNSEGTYSSGNGTSYSAPVVSALAAVIKQVDSSFDGEDVQALLVSTAVDLGSKGYDTDYGYGIVNYGNLIDALTNKNYPIEYVLNDSPEEKATLPDESADSFTIAARNSVTLPVPVREGYEFTGWYEDKDLEKGPVKKIPAGTLGPVSAVLDEEGKVTAYEIQAVKYYAGWKCVKSAEVSKVKVCGIAADYDLEKNTFNVTLPKDTVESMSDINSDDIEIITLESGAKIENIESSEDKSLWNFTTFHGDDKREYTLKVKLSAYEIPVVKEGQSNQKGELSLGSADGKYQTETYEADLSLWFSGATDFKIISNTGDGDIEIKGTKFAYTPGGEDTAGEIISIKIGAYNHDFKCTDNVLLKIQIESKESDSVVTQKEYEYKHESKEDISIEVNIFDNELSKILCDGTELDIEDFDVKEENHKEESYLIIKLKSDFLETLSTGEYWLKLVFSQGKNIYLNLSVIEEAKEENPFVDVNEKDYYYDAVLWAVDNGITKGTSSYTFSPNDKCTRGQMVTFLWNYAGNPQPKSKECYFEDVNPEEYYYNAVLWAVERGITNGITKTEFCPNQVVTRAQAVTFQYRAAYEPMVWDVTPFEDVKIGEYYYDPVVWAVESGITNGITKTEFRPHDYCLRSQIASFLFRESRTK